MAIYIKDSAIKDASLVNGKIVDGTIEQVKLKDPYYTKTEVDNKFTTLSATDTAVNGKYVSAVSETNGIISVTRKELNANEILCNVSTDIFDFDNVQTGLVQLAEKLDNTRDTYALKTFVTEKIESLDVTDAAVANKYVSAVSETDGKIAITRADIPVKDVTLAGTSVVTANVAELAIATPTETKYTTNADGTINTQTKLEVATSKANDLLIGTDVATIKSYVDDKVDEKLIAAGSGEMNVLEGVKVGGTTLAVTDKSVNITLNETKVAGDNGIKSVTLDAGQIKTVYDKFIESAATSGVLNQYGFFSGANELTGKTIADGYAVTTSGTNSAFDEAAGVYTVPSTRAVYQYLDNVLGGITGAMSFKGDCSNIATTTFNDNSLGWTYVASVAGSYAGVTCGVGDMMIVNGVTGGVASWTKVSATTTIENKGAEITTASTELAKVNGTSITASVAVTTPSTCELTTASTEIAKVAGKAINVQLKESATAYTAGSITGSGASQVITYPTLVATNMTGVVTGADVKDISDFVVDYVTKSATAAGSGEMNKVDDVKVDGVSIVSAKVASIPNASTTAKGMVQLATTYMDTNATNALTGAAMKATIDNLVTLDGTQTITGTKTFGTIKANFSDIVDKTTNDTLSSLLDGKVEDVKIGTTSLVTSKVATIPSASTTASGVVKLASTYSDTENTKALTGAALKTTLDAKYEKPATGIAKTDLAADVQTSLGKADTAYQKAATGIPKTDLASAVQTSLDKADSSVQDVKVDGASVVASNVATIPDASSTAKGVVKLATTYTNTNSALALTGAAMKATIDSKADDSNVVHKTGAETINGAKDFKDTTGFEDGIKIASTGTDFITISNDSNTFKFENEDGDPVKLTNIATPTANNDAVNKAYADQFAKLWSGKQADYDAIVTKDPNTVYCIIPD